jgi:low affinity Fe/Cu permease
MDKKQHLFTRLAMGVAKAVGKPPIFAFALGIIMVWGITGPIFKFNDTWQLVINTGTSIVTFLMVFLIQNTQNRDTEAMQIKLDELIYTTRGANVALLDLEQLDEEQLDVIRKKYLQHAAKVRQCRGEVKDDL